MFSVSATDMSDAALGQGRVHLLLFGVLHDEWMMKLSVSVGTKTSRTRESCQALISSLSNESTSI